MEQKLRDILNSVQFILSILIAAFSGFGWMAYKLANIDNSIENNQKDNIRIAGSLEATIRKVSDLEAYNQFNHIRIKEVEGKVSVHEKILNIHDKEIDSLRKRK